ncbi:sugar kinase [Nocardia neocaledoniensis NBRC 108232]|nr:sugar kinase [Nocardia neocaledoniensis NBRC 108232]
MLCVAIDSAQIAAARIVDGDVGGDDVRRAAIPAASVWESCRNLLTEVAGEMPITAIGLAVVGPVDMAAGVVAPVDIPEWRAGFDIVGAIRSLFPSAAVRFLVDGACLALAERNLGHASEAIDSLVVLVSDLVSGGIIVGGLTMVGRTGNAGNFGHMPVPGFDGPCRCGSRGCLDTVAAGRSMVEWARARGWTGQNPRELIDAARNGETVPVEALARAGTALGLVIASAAVLHDVDLVVVGGLAGESGPALWDPLVAAVAAHARTGNLTELRVVASELGEEGVLAGAAILALSGEDEPG